VWWSPYQDGIACTLEKCNTYKADLCLASTNAAPTATGVSITGTATVGQTLTGNYTYADTESNPQGTSTFKWYSGTDAACTGKTVVGTALTYTPTDADKDRFLCFEVTPVATTGTTTGTAVMSAGVKVTAAATAPGYSSTPAPGSTIDVGSASVGVSVSKPLKVSETGNAELKVTSAELTGTNAADFSVTPATLTIADGGAAQDLSIKCTPSADGARTATLKVNHNATGSPATYTLNCTGLNAAPTAKDVKINGTADVGQTLTGSYTYDDAESDTQGTSTFSWYTAADAACTTDRTAVAGATSQTYTVQIADAGKFLCFGVTPVATSGTLTGTEVLTSVAIPPYKVTTATSGAGTGTTGGDGNYVTGTTVTLTATPTGTSVFAGWSPSPCAASFVMPASHLTCTAKFDPPAYALTTATSGTGTGTVSGAGNFAAGTTVALTATPTGTSVFAGWSPSPCAASFVMPANALACTAKFDPNAAPTAKDVKINGTADVGQTLTGSHTYNDAEGDTQGTSTFSWYTAADAACTTGRTAVAGATSQTYTVQIADAGKFLCFGVTPVATSGTLTGAEVLTSVAIPPYKVTTATAGTGTGTTGGDGIYVTGTTVTLTATPTGTSVFAGWSPSPCAASFVMPASHLTCTAKFDPPAYALTTATSGTGTGTVSGAGNFAAGATVALTATPTGTSVFAGWSPSPCAASFVMPANALACTATFSLPPIYSSFPAPGGSVSMTSCTPTDATTTLTVTNKGSDVLNITGITLGGTNATKFSVLPTATADKPLTIAAGKNQAFTITGIGSTTGNFTGTLEITHNAAGSPAKYSLSSVISDCYVPVYYEPSYYAPPPNEPPVADKVYVSTEENKPIKIKLSGNDPDGNWFMQLMRPMTYSVITQPKYGTLSGIAPDLIYTPEPGFIGTDSFTYKMSDGTADSAASTASVIVHQNSNAYVGEKYEMDIFCAEYQGAKYGFRMNYSPLSSDPSGFYWKMDIPTFGKAYSDAKGCISVGNNLQIVIPSALYQGTTYSFTLDSTPVKTDPYALYWKMDLGTFKSR